MSRGYCLKWNKFNTIFQNSFGGLYANQELTDVTFFCEGQFIKCHRLVISAASQYFRDIFVKLPEPNPVVVLSDVKYNVFKALIDFIYCGEIQVHQDLLEAVVKAGEKFRVKGLNEGDDQNSFPSHTVELSDTDFDVQSSAKKRRFDEATTTPTRRSKWGGVSPRLHLNEEVFVPEKLQQPITVNAKLGSRSDIKQELFESIATNEDSFLREAESADFDTYDDTALDDDYEQGEVELEQPDFTLMTGSEDQDQTTTFGLGVEPQLINPIQQMSEKQYSYPLTLQVKSLNSKYLEVQIQDSAQLVLLNIRLPYIVYQGLRFFSLSDVVVSFGCELPLVKCARYNFVRSIVHRILRDRPGDVIKSKADPSDSSLKNFASVNSMDIVISMLRQKCLLMVRQKPSLVSVLRVYKIIQSQMLWCRNSVLTFAIAGLNGCLFDDLDED